MKSFGLLPLNFKFGDSETDRNHYCLLMERNLHSLMDIPNDKGAWSRLRAVTY